MSRGPREPATVEDIHETAKALPHVTVEHTQSNPDNLVYQVGRVSFVFFRNPRPDAVDPETGERLEDVIVIWVPNELDKLALVQDPDSPFFTTPHFDGHPSVLVQASRLHEVERQEIVELVQEAWISRTSRRRANTWLREQGLPELD
ncbi:MAG TPA: MmcQ/YjbR family DNA-binding protein [Acidimicrobiia bacterium]|nr:MmcQ/YjbR family DNA-binding protein [Acidimicrobiia bacterium]